MVLELINISKKYTNPTEISVLQSVNLSVSHGSIVAIMGASGSGKSTILHIAGGLDTPTSGVVNIAGTSILNFSEDQKSLIRLNKLGFIYQHHFLLADFNVIENVILPIKIANKNIATAKRDAEALLETLGLASRINHYPDQLSGGEQQRVAIARAMINNPELILADEPTGSLDHNNAQIVFGLLKKQVKANNCAAVIVTHSQDIANQTDKIYEIKDGVLING